MSDHSVYRLVDDQNGLNEEEEQLIYEIEHMSMEEYETDKISNEDRYYNEEDNNFWRMIR